jgi:hypothetical protein
MPLAVRPPDPDPRVTRGEAFLLVLCMAGGAILSPALLHGVAWGVAVLRAVLETGP